MRIFDTISILRFTDSRFATGANPSAEDGADGELEEGAETVNNLVYSFRLQPTQFDKKSYLTHLKVCIHFLALWGFKTNKANTR